MNDTSTINETGYQFHSGERSARLQSEHQSQWIERR